MCRSPHVKNTKSRFHPGCRRRRALWRASGAGPCRQGRRLVDGLSDYRSRYAQYRLDVDLQEAHRLHPFITIWDDHDFLWNDELGAEALASPEKRDKVILSSAFQTAFRKTIYSGLAPNTFPKKYNSPEFWQTKHYPLDTPSYLLPENVWLHLSDGRTHRTRKWAIASSKRTLLGRQQKEDLAKVYASSDIDSVHLFASGSVLGDYKKTYPIDFDWLLRQSSLRRTLALSGDIHRNSLDEFAGKRFQLYEATSSGAAVRELVVVGERRDNFGILEIDQNSVSINLYAKNKVETKLRRKINRSTWGVV